MKQFIRAASLFFLAAASALASGKNFIIYDRMDYVGKPDLTADKLSKVFLIYESELVMPDPAGKRKHGVLNEKLIRELVRQSYREGYRTISTDIETWFAEKDGQILTPQELKTDFARMYRIFKEENPRAYISNYGLPDEHLHAIRYYQAQVDNEAVLAKWRQFSKRRQMSAATPIPCSTSPVLIWNNGKKMSKPQLPTSKNAIPIKNHRLPLATYYSATGSLYFKQFIDAERWKKMLEFSKKYTDGVII